MKPLPATLTAPDGGPHESDLSRHLLLLNQISLTMQSTLELSRLMHVILSACTAGDGLGFNRAFLALVSEKGDELVGEMGVGPINAAECASIWAAIRDQELTISDFIERFDQARSFQDSDFNQMIRRLRIPLRPEGGVLALTALERKPFLITHASSDSRTDKALIAQLGVEEFATAPLLARDSVLGVIVVDNRFNQRPITRHDRHLLSILAGQAAVAISNSRLYQKVEELNQRLEQRVAESTADLRDRLAELSTLYEVQQAIVTTLDLERVLDLIVRKAVEVLSVETCSIHLVDGERLVQVASYRPLEAEERGYLPNLPALLATRANILPPVTAPDGRDHICLPLRAQERLIGVLHLACNRCDLDAARLSRLAVTIANQAAITIENARLYQDLEEKRAEAQRSLAELRRTQAELIRKERLASLGEMAAVMAHEIRNPLTSIRGFAQRIGRAQENPKYRNYTRIIMEEVDRLNEVIANVLEFARSLEPRFSECDLRETLAETLTLLGEELRAAAIAVECRFPETFSLLRCDAGQLKQLFLNMLQNAIHAMPHGGVLTVALTDHPERVEIEIADTGVGIPADKLERIFEPFFTTKARGTGLGLHLARRIVEGHGGRIRVTSTVGRGTSFVIDIPRARGDSLAHPTTELPA